MTGTEGADRLSIRVRRTLGRSLGGILDSGSPVYLVGGALRDLLSGRRPRDYDLALEGEAGRLSERPARGRWVGRSHRILVLPLLNRRSRGVVQIGVFSGDLVRELGRRDFSVNAMALRIDRQTGEKAEVIDPCGGRSDLERGLLRRPDPSLDPFHEDPVRVLRLVRFVSEFGWSVEAGTLSMARDSVPALSLVAGERLRQEWIRLFSGRFFRDLPERLPADFLEALFAFLSGSGREELGKQERDLRLLKGLDEASRISRHDPLFRLWLFLRASGFQRMGRIHLSVLWRAPWSREERSRLSRWSRCEEFLVFRRGWEKVGPGEGPDHGFREEERFTTSDRSLVLAARGDRWRAIVRRVAGGLGPVEKKRFGIWVARTVGELSRPWKEVETVLDRKIGKRKE